MNKAELNDLLLKMQTGENCIGDTANKILELHESLTQTTVSDDVNRFIQMILNSYKTINNKQDVSTVYRSICDQAGKLNDKLQHQASENELIEETDFYCQSQIEGLGLTEKCVEQCEHCANYFKPIENTKKTK